MSSIYEFRFYESIENLEFKNCVMFEWLLGKMKCM